MKYPDAIQQMRKQIEDLQRQLNQTIGIGETVTVSSAYTVAAGVSTVIVDTTSGNVTITIPAGFPVGRKVKVGKLVSANSVSITSSETLPAILKLTSQDDFVELQKWDDWKILKSGSPIIVDQPITLTSTYGEPKAILADITLSPGVWILTVSGIYTYAASRPSAGAVGASLYLETADGVIASQSTAITYWYAASGYVNTSDEVRSSVNTIATSVKLDEETIVYLKIQANEASGTPTGGQVTAYHYGGEYLKAVKVI